MRIGSALRQSPTLLQLWVNPEPVDEIRVSDDGRYVAAQGRAVAVVWNTATGSRVLSLQRSGSRHGLLPDGRRLVALTGRGIELWDLAGAAPRRHLLTGEGAWQAAAMTADGQHVYGLAEDGWIWKWSAGLKASADRLLSVGRGTEGLRVSSDGRRLLTFDLRGLVRVWDPADGRELAPAMRHEGGLRRVEFSPGGRWIVTLGRHETPRVWETNSGKLIGALTGVSHIADFTFAPREDQLATLGNRFVQVWDLATATPVGKTLIHPTGAVAAAFSPDGRIRTLDGDGTLQVWDPQTGRATAPGSRVAGPVQTARFALDGRRIVAQNQDGSVRLWDTASVAAAPDLQVRAGAPAPPPSFDRDGKVVAVLDGAATLSLHSAVPGKAVSHSVALNEPPRLLALRGDGQQIAVAAGDKVSIQEVRNGRVTAGPVRLPGEVRALRFSPDGSRLLVLAGGRAYVLHAPMGTVERASFPCFAGRSERECLTQTSFSPDGEYLFAIQGENGVQVARRQRGSYDAFLRLDEPAVGAVFSPDSRWLATLRLNGTVRVWRLASGEPVGAAMWHGAAARALAWSPDGKRLATGGLDGIVRLWSISSRKVSTSPLRHRAPVEQVVFRADGRQLATMTTAGEAQVWDATTGEPVTLRMHHAVSGRIAFSASGQRLLVAQDDGSATAWDLQARHHHPEAMFRLAGLLLGQQVQDDGVPTTVPVDRLEAWWRDLRVRAPRRFTCSPAQELAWHRQEAEASEAAHLWEAALPHLEALLKAQPRDWDLHHRQARALAHLGSWAEAARAFAAAEERGLHSYTLYYELALAQLGAGDHRGYRETCIRMLRRFEQSREARATDITAWTFSLGPSPRTEAHRALANLERVIAEKSEGPDASLLQTLGALQLRLGRLDPAEAHLRDAMARRGHENDPHDQLFLALGLGSAGRRAEARQWLERSDRTLQPLLRRQPPAALPWDTALELRLLFREAGDLLAPAPPE